MYAFITVQVSDSYLPLNHAIETTHAKSAIQLKKLVNALWEVRAIWKTIAESDDLIQIGTCEVRLDRTLQL